MAKKKGKTIISVYLEDQLKSDVEKIAAEEQRPLSQMIAVMLQQSVNSRKIAQGG